MPRKIKSQDENPYEVIRGMWEGAYVSHFVRLFRKKFGFSCLSTQDLEEALVVEESVVLADILARLLRCLTGNNNILIANFDTFLRNLLIKEKADVPRYLENGTTWQELTPEEKLSILKWLIDHVHQEKEEEFADYLDENYSPDDLRGICAGQDAFNNVYWYLDDLRLYREATKKQSKKEWECVCLTLSDWYSFLKQFRKTTNVQEKELYTYLNFELFPIIEVQLLDKSKTLFQNKETNKIYLTGKEREELEDMLEKKTFLECSNGLVKSLDVNGADNGCHDKHNGAIGNVKCASEGNGKTDFKIKTEENQTSSEVNHCDGHVNISENITSVNNNSMNTTKMDVKINVSNVCVNNSCGNSCPTTCTNTQASTNSTSNESSSVCSNGSHCSTTSLTATPVSAPPSRDNVQDVNVQQSQSDNPSDSSSVTSNKENAPPSSGSKGTDIPPMSAMSNMVGSTSTPATTASVQPLPSNMVNKTSFPMDTQYMQQQSQIFVFSTELANKAAESYLSGHFPSIIAYHCAQPWTKSFLEKYPLKVQQFNRQNPGAWLNSLASIKQGGRPIKGAISQFPVAHGMNSRFPGPSPVATGPIPCTGPCNVHGSSICSAPRVQGPWPNAMSGNGMGPDMCGPSGSQSWPSQQFGHGVNSRFPNPMSQGMALRQMGPSNSPIISCTNNMQQNMGGSSFQGQSMCPGSLQGPGGPSTLTGVKIPDENLTPQQRQHREEQLAMIRKMQLLLFPEQQHVDQNQIGMLNQQQNIGSVPVGMLQHGSQPRFGPGGEMCVHSGMEGCFSPHQQCMNDHEHSHPTPDMFIGPGMMQPGFHQQNFPNAFPNPTAQLEWQKMQHQFYEEKRKKPGPCGTLPLSHPSSVISGQSSMQHQQAQTPTQSQSAPQQILQHPPQPQTPLQQQQSLNSPSPNMGLSPGTRMQGPPPPYHQTTRRSMPSPHPASPNPSSLSLPSPRMVSGLSSPADPSRQFSHPTPPGSRLPHPSPGPHTPAGSNSLHTTPLNSPKPLNSSSGPGSNSGALIKTPTTPSNTSSTPSGTPTSSCVNALPSSGPSTPAGQCSSNRKQGQQCGDVQDTNSAAIVSSADFTSPSCAVSTPSNIQGEMFCHSTHQCSQHCSKQDHCVHPPALCHKEPSLMPVPSPQQIQYLNAFDGQELTIQKQPNTSIRELDMMSPASIPPSMVMSTGSHNHFQSPEGTSFPNTPGSCPALENSQDSLSGRYPASAPASVEGNMQRFTVPSPQVPGFDTNSRHSMPVVQSGDSPMPRFPGVHNMDMMRVPGPGIMHHGSVDEHVRFAGHSQQGPLFGHAQGGMDNMVRFPGSASEAIQRFRGPSPHSAAPIDMLHSRFIVSSPHMPGAENMPAQSFPSPVHTMSSTGSPCIGGNFAENNMVHSHLHNLQKMTPPFESIVGNKASSDVASPMGSCSSNPSLNNSANSTVTPYGAGSPLTPASQIGPSHRLTHFDPIASMAAMSESTGPLVTSVGNAQTHQNMITSHMNMSNVPVASDPVGSNQANMMGFNPGMSSVRGVLTNSVANSVPNQHNHYIMSPHMSHSVGCGSQNVNNSYINAPMGLQQQNVQNVVTTTAFNAGGQMPNMNPHGPVSMQSHPGCHESGTSTLSCSVTTNHPIMHSAVSVKSSNVNMCLSGPRQNHPQSFPGQPIVQRNAMPVGAAVSPSMMVRTSGAAANAFNSTNIQVKASAPNTIQYLPARPQNATAPNRPASLEFLQRFATPLTNLDNKVPTHNLQYFPNSRGSNTPTGHGGNTSLTSASCVGPGMMTGQRPMNMMMGPMMRGNSPAMPHAGNQIFPVGTGMPGPESQIFGRPQCPPGSQLNSQMVPVNTMTAGPGVPMFPNKHMPLSMGGMAPDATQPLPPSMGQSFNYKQSPFYGPTTADPNYAVQFHNFQQQLYATNTRGSQMNSQNNLSGQGFFGPK